MLDGYNPRPNIPNIAVHGATLSITLWDIVKAVDILDLQWEWASSYVCGRETSWARRTRHVLSGVGG